MDSGPEGVDNGTLPFIEFISDWSHYLATKTVFGGEFDWGGLLLKSNVRFQRLSQVVWKSTEEYKGIR